MDEKPTLKVRALKKKKNTNFGARLRCHLCERYGGHGLRSTDNQEPQDLRATSGTLAANSKRK